MKFRTLLSFAALTASTITYAQTIPCVGGMANGYPCSGYDLVSHLTINELQGGIEGNDIWGWTHPDTGEEYALMGLDNGTAFVSLCDPENPVLIGNLATHTNPSIWRDIKVYQNHAFIVSEAGGHGMQVFDLMQLSAVSNPPVVFEETAHYGLFGSAHNLVINEETGFAYPVGSFELDGGPQFVNIQDPTNPVAAGGYDGDGYTHDAQVVVYSGPDATYVGKEICFASNENTLTIIDIDDKSDPSQISRTGYEDASYAHQGWLTEDHRYFMSNDETDELNGIVSNTRTIIWDCLDLDAPVVIGEYFGPSTSIDHNLYVKGDKVYQANYNSGFRVLDFSDIANANLTEIGYFDVHPSNDNAAFNGAWSVYPYFESGLIIISSIEQGLFVVKASEEDLPSVNCSVVGLNEESLLSLEVFPNPVHNQFHIRLAEYNEAEVTLLDAIGRTVYKKQFSNQPLLSIDVQTLESGIYHLLVRTDIGLGYQRVSVE